VSSGAVVHHDVVGHPIGATTLERSLDARVGELRAVSEDRVPLGLILGALIQEPQAQSARDSRILIREQLFS
jgi:hypothetical protein